MMHGHNSASELKSELIHYYLIAPSGYNIGKGDKVNRKIFLC